MEVEPPVATLPDRAAAVSYTHLVRLKGQDIFAREMQPTELRRRVGNAQALLLAAGKTQSALFQAVLDLVPEGGTLQGAFHQLVQLCPVSYTHLDVYKRQEQFQLNYIKNQIWLSCRFR